VRREEKRREEKKRVEGCIVHWVVKFIVVNPELTQQVNVEPSGRPRVWACLGWTKYIKKKNSTNMIKKNSNDLLTWSAWLIPDQNSTLNPFILKKKILFWFF
jgi:hypothetical protein